MSVLTRVYVYMQKGKTNIVSLFFCTSSIALLQSFIWHNWTHLSIEDCEEGYEDDDDDDGGTTEPTPSKKIATCHGKSPGSASCPPTIRLFLLRPFFVFFFKVLLIWTLALGRQNSTKAIIYLGLYDSLFWWAPVLVSSLLRGAIDAWMLV